MQANILATHNKCLHNIDLHLQLLFYFKHINYNHNKTSNKHNNRLSNAHNEKCQLIYCELFSLQLSKEQTQTTAHTYMYEQHPQSRLHRNNYNKAGVLAVM